MIWIGKRVGMEWTKICSKILLVEILFELFCSNFFCSLLKLNDRGEGGVAMDFAWWTRSRIFGHWPRESGCARFDCMFTNVDYVLIENEDADTTRARPPPLSVPFLFNPFIDPCWMGRKPEQKGIASAKGSETFFEVYPEGPLSKTRKQEFNIHSQGK